MRTAGQQPRILLTNVKQLELLLTRQADVELFDGNQLEFIVFDEAHTYGGAEGAETACLIRRLRAFCGRDASEIVCIGTSATLVDADRGADAGREFAERFFGVVSQDVVVVGEEYQREDWPSERRLSPAPSAEPAELLRQILVTLGNSNDDRSRLARAYQLLTGVALDGPRSSRDADGWEELLYTRFAEQDLCFRLAEALSSPRALAELAENLSAEVGRPVSEEEILCWLALGAASRLDGRPLLRPVVHAFVSGIGGAVVTFPQDHTGSRLWFSAEEERREQGEDRLFPLRVTTCKTCGQHDFVHHVADLSVGPPGLGGGEAVGDRRVWRPLDEAQGGGRVVLLDRLVSAQDDDEDPARTQPVFCCRDYGALHPDNVNRCDACGRQLVMELREPCGTLSVEACAFVASSEGKPLHEVMVGLWKILTAEFLRGHHRDVAPQP